MVSSKTALIGGVIGFLGSLIALCGIIGAALLYQSACPFRPFFIRQPIPIFIPIPNTGYNALVQHVSELGVGPTSYMFNTSLILAGVLAVPFFICLLQPLGGSWTARIGVASGIVAFIGLIGLAVYTETQYAAHIFFSNVFFIFILASIVLITYTIRSSDFFTWVHVWLGVILVAADIVFFVLIFTTGFSAVMEWAVVLIILVWTFAVSLQMIIKGREVA